MAAEIIPTQIFILILVIILAAVVVVIISQWRKVSQSNNSLKLLEKEIELKKIAMVEKDLESKRLMENPVKLPEAQQEELAQISLGLSIHSCWHLIFHFTIPRYL